MGAAGGGEGKREGGALVARDHGVLDNKGGSQRGEEEGVQPARAEGGQEERYGQGSRREEAQSGAQSVREEEVSVVHILFLSHYHHIIDYL